MLKLAYQSIGHVSNKLRSNVPADSVSEYFKRSVTIPIIGHVLTPLSTRFQRETITAVKRSHHSICYEKPGGESTEEMLERGL